MYKTLLWVPDCQNPSHQEESQTEVHEAQSLGPKVENYSPLSCKVSAMVFLLAGVSVLTAAATLSVSS